MMGSVMILNYQGFVSMAPAATRALLSEPHVVSFAQFIGIQFIVLAVAMTYVWSNASDDSRNWLGGIYALGWFKIIVACHHITIPPQKMDVIIAFAGLFFTSIGVRRNLGITGQEEGGIFEGRNALRVVIYVSTFFWLMGTAPFFANTMEMYTVGGGASLFSSPMANELQSFIHLIQGLFIVLILVSWCSENDDVTRAALCGSVLYHLSGVIILTFYKSMISFGENQFYFVIGVNSVLTLLSAKALYDDVEGDIKGWLKDEFAWSYTPLKGGLYLTVMHLLTLGHMDAFFFHRVFGSYLLPDPKDGPAYGWHSDFGAAYVQAAGFIFITIGIVAYFIVRASDDGTARVLSYVFLGFNAIGFVLLDQWFEPAKKLGVTELPIFMPLMSMAMFAGQCAALYHDHVHSKGKSSPKRGRKRKSN